MHIKKSPLYQYALLLLSEEQKKRGRSITMNDRKFYVFLFEWYFTCIISRLPLVLNNLCLKLSRFSVDDYESVTQTILQRWMNVNERVFNSDRKNNLLF